MPRMRRMHMAYDTNPKTLLAGLLVAVLCTVGFVWAMQKRTDDALTMAAVARMPIAEEVLASGKVEAPSQLDLHFRDTARLAARPVRIGDTVQAGEVLAKQDAAQLTAQLAEMQAGVDIQRARLAQLLAGAATEDVRAAETAVRNADRAADDARAAVLEVLQDAYTKADDAVRTKADAAFLGGRSGNPQLAFTVSDSNVKHVVESGRAQAERILAEWAKKNTERQSGESLSAYANEAQRDLREMLSFLDMVAQALNVHVSGISSSGLADLKAAVSTSRANVNAALAAIVSASDAYRRAEGALTAAKDALALKLAAARPEDIALHEAQVRQAEASMQRITLDLEERNMLAPVAGTVIDTEGEIGEIVGPAVPVVSLMPLGGLQVTVNVSEGNVINVKEGQTARITLDAFGDETVWRGTVVRVNPAGEVIGGAVYYPTTVIFESEENRIRPGMTANVWIETASKPSALVVPASAVWYRDGAAFIRVRAAGGAIVEQQVVTGIAGSDGTIEIIQGANEQDEVVVDAGL